ncbi:MAG: inositol 2-dehydrogenase [Elstera sp.]|jgi:myo-inositol 2-dehydrogenase/D-chiro-inositol 1-dehydrogenase
MVSLAVLGAGRIGQIHARNIAANGRVTLLGVFDVDGSAAQKLAAACGSKVIDLEAAFTADAIVICTPTDTHADLIERAAKAGKAVFCEKPVDLSQERVRTCLAVVKAAGIKLMVGFNRRFDPSFQALQTRLAGGEIGNLELLTILSRDPAPPPISYIARSGGLFRDMMIHDLDMARFLLGEEPVEVYAVGSALVDPAIGDAGDVDTAAVTLRTASGKICQISNSRRATYGYDQRIEAHGSKGLLRAGNMTQTTVESATAAGFTTDPALPFFLERYASAYRAELDAFIDALVDGKPISPDGTDGLKSLVLADAAAESVKTGVPVKVSL